MSEEKPPYNFGGLPDEFTDYKKAQVVVVPVPFDLTTSWMSGASHGPKALIEASGYMELYDIETKSEVYRKTKRLKHGFLHSSTPVVPMNFTLPRRSLGHSDETSLR